MNYTILTNADIAIYQAFNESELFAKYHNGDQKARAYLASKVTRNLSGEVYLVSGFLANEEIHKEIVKNSTATTIEGMALEYIAFKEQEQLNVDSSETTGE